MFAIEYRNDDNFTPPPSFFRYKDTGRMHKDSKGKALCKIYILSEKKTRYSGDKLRELRKERGVGNVRKINKEVN